MWTFLCQSDIIIWWHALVYVIMNYLSWSFLAYILTRLDAINKKIIFFIIIPVLYTIASFKQILLEFILADFIFRYYFFLI